MATVERFEELEVWQRARGLTNRIYDLSDEGEFARDFGLKDQMRRAAVSIMSNIAEGFESRTQALSTNSTSATTTPCSPVERSNAPVGKG